MLQAALQKHLTVSHEAAKVSANNAVPGDTLALIELYNH
jgi:hypothetical protein